MKDEIKTEKSRSLQIVPPQGYRLMLVFLFFAPMAMGATIVRSASNVLELDLEFSRTGPVSDSSRAVFRTFSFGEDQLDGGELLEISFYEDSLLGEPFQISELSPLNADSHLSGFTFIIFPEAEPMEPLAFTDLAGALRLEMVSGTVDIDHIFIETRSNGERYIDSNRGNFRLVPEVSVAGMLGLGLLGFTVRRRR